MPLLDPEDPHFEDKAEAIQKIAQQNHTLPAPCRCGVAHGANAWPKL